MKPINKKKNHKNFILVVGGKMNSKKQKKLLYKHFDGKLSGKEETELMTNLKNSKELQRENEIISTLRDKLRESGQVSFSPYFEQKVMQKINGIDTAQNEILFDVFFSQFRKLAVSAVAVVVLLFSLNAGKAGEFNLEKIFNIPEVTLEDVADPIFMFLWSK